MALFWEKRYKLFIIALLVPSVVILLLKYNGIIGSPSQIPEIVFMCERYNSWNELCEISFIDKYGKCYFSNDTKVCTEVCKYYDFSEDLVDAYRAGEIEDKIKLCDSCNKSEVMKRYRKIYKIAERGDISKNYIFSDAIFTTTGQEWDYPERWVWKWLYFDFSGRIRYVILHEKEETIDDYITTKNRQVNQIYEWCKDMMDEVDMGYGYQ